MGTDGTWTLAALDAAPAERLGAVLRDCCSSPAWVRAMSARRPFGHRAALLAASDEVFAHLTGTDVEAALAGHPRIGDRAMRDGTDARWSRHEQRSVTEGGAGLQVRLREGNQAYEQRFGRVFLIRADGRSAQDMLEELTRRLGNDDEAEATEVKEQLRQITRLRLERLLST